MLRVALLSPLFESVPPRLYGGTERVVDNLCRGLTAAGVEVTLFASADSNTQAKLIPVTETALRLRDPQPLDPNVFNFRMMSDVLKFASQFDVIHNHHDYWMLPLTEILDTPVLTTLHGRLDLPDLHPVLRNFPRAPFVSISNAQRTPLPELDWRATIHHGMSFDGFRFHDRPGQYLAFLGRINHEKRPEWAIEIAKKSGVPLKIAAKIDGAPGREYYDAFIKPHVDGKFIEYVGEISEGEKSDFLGNALALAFPIDWPEPFGLVMIEALACGTPVLARPYGSVPEILLDGTTGFIRASVEELASLVPRLSSISRSACRQWALERFSLQRMTEDYLNVYRSLARGARTLRENNRRNLLYPLERPADRDSENILQGRSRIRSA